MARLPGDLEHEAVREPQDGPGLKLLQGQGNEIGVLDKWPQPDVAMAAPFLVPGFVLRLVTRRS